MRYIRNISDDQNKSGDTDNIFRFNLLHGSDIFNFGDYPISINIANSSGYILSMVPEKEFGNSVVKLDFNDQSLKSLTPDNYLLEVEVKFPDGTTATFPTKGGMPFTVNSNLKNTAGHLVPTVTFDEVLNAVDKKVNNYLATVVKGDKGDTGVVDTTKDYTWTGNNAFTQSINGKLEIKPYPLTTLQELSTKMYTYSGKWVGGSDTITDMPEPGYGVISVDSYGKAETAGTITVTYTTDNPKMFVSYANTPLTWLKVANDANVVHKTGDETVAGNKIFTDKATFNKTISGALATRKAPFSDFNEVATHLQDYQGKWNGGYDIIANAPEAGWFIVDIQTWSDGSNLGHLILRYTDHNAVWVGLTVSGKISWKKLASDDTVMHLTGAETVAGDKTFTGATNFTQPIQGNLNGNATTANTANDPNAAKLSADNSFTGANAFTGKTSFWFKQIQWTSGIMQGTWYIQRMGNWVNAKFDMSANTGTGTTTLSLPVGYCPLSPFVREVEQGVAGLNKNGTVLVSQSYTGANAMTFSYPTNDPWPTA